MPLEESKEENETLHKLSRCIINIRAIREAHLTEPIAEDKELVHTYYFPERYNLIELLKTPIGLLILPNQSKLLESLPDNLLFNKAKTERAKKQLDEADDFTSEVLGAIQVHRSYGANTPTTGLEDGPLKTYLTKYLAQKRNISKYPIINFKTNGKNFEFNIINGSFKLGKIKDRFGTTTQEFRMLKCLVENRDTIVIYGDICLCLGLNTACPQRDTILTILKRIKNKMGILPKTRTCNPDIFENDTNSGYGILVD
ncbi:MAG: hypothetical protein NTV03_01365 [Candidatus Nomurabacteria bacterium]|nr:hypothetical protein [Candidatus Nomurabacteria bacterium]